MRSRAYIEDLMYGRKRSFLIEALLFFLSFLYRLGVRLRFFAYAVGILRRKKLPVPVISVGNITLGGTGKTPTVVYCADFFLRHGKRVLILSRGYGRPDDKKIEIVSDCGSILLDAHMTGDEPIMIAFRLPKVSVVVGRDRFIAGMHGLDIVKPDVVILDDGFQHLRLKRDLDIVLLDGTAPFGNDRLFPAGILREPLSALKRADVVMITRSNHSDRLDELKNTVKQLTDALIVTSRHVPRDLIDIFSGETRSLSALNGTRIFAFAGIARPNSFFDLLSTLGADIVGFKAFPDHYKYEKSDIAEIFRLAVDRNAAMVVTTEKDGVRIRNQIKEGIWALRIDLDVIEKQEFERVLFSRL